MDYDFDTVTNRKGTGSAKWDAAGKFFKQEGLLPMWVADMDFRAPPPIIDALKRTADQGFFGYYMAPDSYYDAVIDWMRRRHDWHIKKEWFVLGTGVVPALRLIVKTFVKPGEQVVVQTPVYYPFFSVIDDNGCEILENPLRLNGSRYEMDLDDLERKITPRTKMLILCNPHNPVSRVWGREELKRLGEICLKQDIIIVADEIHHDIVYPGHIHVPFTNISDDFWKNTIVCTAASKTFSLPGLKTSNIIIANHELRKAFAKTVNVCGMAGPDMFGLAATEAACRYCEDWMLQLLPYLKGNIDHIAAFFKERLPGVKMSEPQGTYLLWLDLRDMKLPPDKLADFMRNDAGVGTESGTIFRAPGFGFERMNIGCPRAIIDEALSKMETAAAKYR